MSILTTHHCTEILARKAARRLGNNFIRIIESKRGFAEEAPTAVYFVEAVIGAPALRKWEAVVYEGKGRLA